jgi:glycosyltransferase involved in cell wall biosynthesis
MGSGDFVTSQDPFEAGIVAFITAKVFKLRLQFQLHTDCFDDYYRRHSIMNMIRAFIAKILIPRADNLRTVSERVASTIRDMRLLEADKISVLPIYTDVDAVRRRVPTFSLKQKYNEFSTIIVTVSRLEKEKNLTLALSAFQKILKRLPSAGLVIAGSGREDKWLHEYARHLGILASVRFEGWVTDTAALYRSADLMLQTSFYEGYGLSIVEALALGCPAVSTDVGIAKEAGAEVCNFDPGEIAIVSLNMIESGKRGELNPKFKMSKTQYLEQYKDTFK